MMRCDLCPRNCGAVRRADIFGYCGVGDQPKIARVAPHYDEEPVISGTRGAGTIFFCGCSLRCVYCQNHSISSGSDAGVTVTPYTLSEEYRRLEDMGVHNIEFVTPTHYTEAILESLNIYRPPLPLIWNTSGYEKVETLRRLEGIIDVWLPDFKYSDNTLAKRLSSCPDYVEVATAAIGEMLRQAGGNRVEDGLIRRGVIIRHLVLPSHVRNSLGVLELIRKRFGTDVPVSLMSQYFPSGRAQDYPDINRRITAREYGRVLDRLYALGLDGYAQELTSADAGYVPVWDYHPSP